MLLAEGAETSLGQWGTFITMVCSAIGGLIFLLYKSIKDNRREDQKVKREDERESQKMQVQIEQRDVLRQLEVGQSLQNGKLASIVSVNESHHTEMLRALSFTCKSQPTIVQQINEKPKETM